MTARIVLSCDCTDECPAEITLFAQDTSDARLKAKGFGWDSDVVFGDTVDSAPGCPLPKGKTS